jgi:hypothetical protein
MDADQSRETPESALRKLRQILSDGIYKEKLTITVAGQDVWIGEPLVLLCDEALAVSSSAPTTKETEE